MSSAPRTCSTILSRSRPPPRGPFLSSEGADAATSSKTAQAAFTNDAMRSASVFESGVVSPFAISCGTPKSVLADPGIRCTTRKPATVRGSNASFAFLATGAYRGAYAARAASAEPSSFPARHQPGQSRAAAKPRSLPGSIATSVTADRLAEALDNHRHPLATTNAHRFQADGLVVGGQAVEQCAQDAGPGHPERVTERDRAPMWIELVAEGVDAQLARGGDDLGGEGFIDLDDVDVVDRHLCPLEGLPRGLDRTEAHDLRLERRRPGGDDARQRSKAELLRLAVGGDHDRGCAVVQRTGIAGGDSPVLAEGRFQCPQHLHRGVRPRPVIPLHRGAVVERHRDDLAVEESAIARLDGARLALDGVAIHFLAADLFQVRHILPRLPHRDIAEGLPLTC